MNNVKNLKIKNAIVINNEKESITLIENETKVSIVTDDTEFENSYSGTITFLTKDGLTINNYDFIPFEYIEEINIV